MISDKTLYTPPLYTNLQCTVTPLQARAKHFQVTMFPYNCKEKPKYMYLFVDDNLLKKVRYLSDSSQSTQKPVQGKCHKI